MSLLRQIIIASLAAFAASQCTTENFFESGGSCYGVYDAPLGINLTWAECRQACQSMDASSDLATFANAEELETFSITWLEESANYPADPNMWIGVSKVDGVWQTLDDVVVSFQNLMWQESHPHDMGVEVFLQDTTLASGVNSYNRLLYTCSMGENEHHSRCLCEISAE